MTASAPCFLDERRLGVARDGGEHTGAGHLRELHGEDADPARRRVNEHGSAGTHRVGGMEQVIGGQPLDQERGAVGEAHGVGERDRPERRRRQTVLRVRPAGEGGHAHAGPEVSSRLRRPPRSRPRLPVPGYRGAWARPCTCPAGSSVSAKFTPIAWILRAPCPAYLRLGNIGQGQHLGAAQFARRRSLSSVLLTVRRR